MYAATQETPATSLNTAGWLSDYIVADLGIVERYRRVGVMLNGTRIETLMSEDVKS
jgi:hypothetical protein